MKYSWALCLILIISCQSPNDNSTVANQQPTENKPTTEEKKQDGDPATILDHYLALPVDFFSYSICGMKDSEAERKKAIKKENIRNGYIKFDEECTDSPNEIVLFKNRKDKKDIIALTKYHGDVTQTFYLLEYNNGKWQEIKDSHFPSDDKIKKYIEKQKYKPAVQEALKNAQESDGTVSTELLLPEIGYDVKVIINRELTKNNVQLATIKWTGYKFQLQ